MRSVRSRLWPALKPVLPSFVVLLVLEILLRVTGVGPLGHFDFLLPGAVGGLYPPNETITNDWGRIPYVVHTNDLGLRSTGHRDLRIGARRIVMIGDSITDGFFVDDEGTIPHLLQRALDEPEDGRYEVFNAARGGGSIDKELAILREVGLGLGPEVVILTFVTNDIWELKGKTRRQLEDHELQIHRRNIGLVRRAGLWLFTSTALGEVIFGAWWTHVVAPAPSEGVPQTAPGDDRYAIPGGADHEANVARFRRKFDHQDGLVLTETFAPGTQALVDNYLYSLEEFVRTSRENGVAPVFVYLPAYPQVYDLETPSTIQAVLRDACGELSMPFLDLTEALRTSGAERVLHLAPVDFHLNPAGNAVVARAILGFLGEQGLLGAVRPRPPRSPDRSWSRRSSSSAGG